MKQHIRMKQDDEYESYITITKQGENKYLVRETLVKTGTYEKKEGTHAKKRTVTNEAQAELAAQDLFALRAKSIVKRTANSTSSKSVSPLRDVCNDLMNKMNEKEHIVFSPTWKSDATNRSALTYFRSTLLPFIETHYSSDKGYTQIYAIEIEQLFNSCFSNFSLKRNNSGEEDILAVSLSKQFYRANIVYQFLRDNYPELNLPETDFNVGNASGRQREQFKELDVKVRNKFAAKMKEKAKTEPLYAMAGVMMLDGMLRSSESCAMGEDCVFQINSFNHFVHVKYQLDKNNVRTPILKSDNAYRLVVLSYWGTQMVKLCLYYAKKMGLTPGNSGIKTNDFSQWVLEILKGCGLSKSFIAESEDDFRRYLATTTESVVSDDLSAYILRRDGASRLRNYCKATETELDVQMGHKHDGEHINFVSREWMITYAEKLERYVYDPEISRNQAICHVSPIVGDDKTIECFSEVKIRNDLDVEISFNYSVLCEDNVSCTIEYSDKDALIECDSRLI